MSTALANMFIFVCISCTFFTVNGHDNNNKHPVGKLIRGTFDYFDPQEPNPRESARLYVCKAKRGRYYFSVIIDDIDFCCWPYLLGNGVFMESGINYHDNVISNEQCFYQLNGEAKEVTSCQFDVADLCDKKEVTLSFMFGSEPISLKFTKISVKDELIGNDDIAPYQCGIPWDGDVAEEDSFPLAFVSTPIWWAEDGREIQTLVDDVDGCFATILPDGTFTGVAYDTVTELVNWDNKHLILSYIVPELSCTGSRIYIRVDRDTILVSWQEFCQGFNYGAGFLSYKSDNEDYERCPIFAPGEQNFEWANLLPRPLEFVPF